MSQDIESLLDAQRRSFLKEGFPSVEVRLDRLNRMIQMLLAYEGRLVHALYEDFGGRARFSSKSGDILGSIKAIDYTREHLSAWMQPAPVMLPPEVTAAAVTAEVVPVPLGVVGVIVPWNGAVLMTCSAVAGILAAGNRAMVKIAEAVPQTAALLSSAFSEFFTSDEVFVAPNEPGLASRFSRLKFDHILFTGSSSTGKKVMSAAAQNLVPVTLELGGKCPAVLGKGADLEAAAARIATGKLAGAGQVCVATDYVYVPRGQKREFVEAVLKAAEGMYPSLLDSEDYTAVMGEHNRLRVRGLVEDALLKGAEIFQLPGQTLDRATGGRLPLVVATEVTPEMDLMQEEIFGPVLAVMEYDDFAESVQYIADNPHPLSASYFGTDERERDYFIHHVQSGGVVINDVRIQLFYEALPFGGVGASGIGRYRGFEGFKTFSNMKTVVYQSASEHALAVQRPPFTPQAFARVDLALEKYRLEDGAEKRV
ncbi:aldehyde dehydrogenase family protein [Ensifer sp. ENS05]|uniref:aldehyde dehydrogenase family protein n=1 Tax=Ensifer sp. ENS05 TaxID=2769277 RepID=UPI0017824A09|nr:aldehyde dehydrogenase family protein [Ensifer sp. ENS05]MBD9596921.1 aldehyde dehydrogenase family protein [Ensifer sp. ENS05]